MLVPRGSEGLAGVSGASVWLLGGGGGGETSVGRSDVESPAPVPLIVPAGVSSTTGSSSTGAATGVDTVGDGGNSFEGDDRD